MLVQFVDCGCRQRIIDKIIGSNCVAFASGLDRVPDFPHIILVHRTRENGTNTNLARSLFDSVHNDARL